MENPYTIDATVDDVQVVDVVKTASNFQQLVPPVDRKVT